MSQKSHHDVIFNAGGRVDDPGRSRNASKVGACGIAD
jgi:hypothetical protein